MERLSVRGAREHNLRNVDLDLPRDALIVFTGLSGSGKSSLAFDTIFAEGQRRYVESLSSYARQFLGQMDKPDVDFIEGLSPAVSIDQKSTSRNPRSTVGTITEIYDYLRLLFARIGRPHCPVCGEFVTKQTPQAIVDRVLEMPESTRFQVLAPVVRERKGEFVDLLSSLTAQGYSRVRVDGAVSLIGEVAGAEEAGEALDRGGRRPADRQDDRPRQRITDSVETALRLAEGIVILDFVDLPDGRPAPAAPLLGEDGLPERPPAGPGRTRAAVVLVQLAVRCLPGVLGARHQEGGRPGAGRPGRGADLATGRDPPLEHRPDQRILHPAARRPGRHRGVLDGHPVASAARQGPQRRAERRRRRRCTSATRTGTAGSAPTTPSTRASSRSSSGGPRRRSRTTPARSTRGTCGRCPARPARAPGCARRSWPSRIQAQADGDIREVNLAEISAMSIGEAEKFFPSLVLSERDRMIAEPVLKEVGARLGFLLDVGLEYLSLSRPAAHPVRWRGAADPAGHPDRVRPGRRAVRAGRAVDRSAPAGQPPADPDADPAARPGEHPDRRRARRGHHPHRGLGRRHRPRGGGARRQGRGLRHRSPISRRPRSR